jgi:alkanesulfonate monooxygenase SsuD/methylene tetrahydromethanopterin reductase-like flavin-dependent oxidoreductase (luciferase family)
MAILHQHCERIGRDPQSIVKSWFGRLAVANTEADALALGGGKWTRQNAFVGTPAQVVDQLGAFVAAGVTGFQFEILGFPNNETLGLVTQEVLSKF